MKRLATMLAADSTDPACGLSDCVEAQEHLPNGIQDIYERALDLLSDGIALLRRDGSIVYANAALRHLAAADGELRIERNAVAFSTRSLRDRFAGALSAAER